MWNGYGLKWKCELVRTSLAEEENVVVNEEHMCVQVLWEDIYFSNVVWFPLSYKTGFELIGTLTY